MPCIVRFGVAHRRHTSRLPQTDQMRCDVRFSLDVGGGAYAVSSSRFLVIFIVSVMKLAIDRSVMCFVSYR
jgi:hypothetical protein